MKKIVGQQGEVRIIKIDNIPDVKTRDVIKEKGGFIISHSESGHHHLLSDGEVMERTENVPSGMQIFYAIAKDPVEFYQDAPGNAHDPFLLDAGFYEFRISREYDPFTKQARRVAD